MSKYKVGERVWDKQHKRYCIIDKITNKSILVNNYHLDKKLKIVLGCKYEITETDLHATFDTMITRLGFEKYENDVLIQYDKKTETTLGNKTVSIRIIKGKKDYMIWTTDDYIAKMPYGQKIIITNINHDLHEALTQLMRELKANEI